MCVTPFHFIHLSIIFFFLFQLAAMLVWGLQFSANICSNVVCELQITINLHLYLFPHFLFPLWAFNFFPYGFLIYFPFFSQVLKFTINLILVFTMTIFSYAAVGVMSFSDARTSASMLATPSSAFYLFCYRILSTSPSCSILKHGPTPI